MLRFCLDTNVLIQAKNGPYGFDIVPGFWNWLDEAVQKNIVYSTISVYDEITEGNDELAAWVKERKDTGFFIEPSADAQEKIQEIADFVVSNFESQHAGKFLGGADPWVIAQALIDGANVVTHESFSGPGTKRVKIPAICKKFDVSYVDTYAMLRLAGAKFQ